MYGQWVTLNLGEDVKCMVFVLCSPDTPEEKLIEKALNKLKIKIEEKLIQ